MTDQLNMLDDLERLEFNDILSSAKIETKERKYIDVYVHIDGVKWDASSLLEDMYAIDNDPIYWPYGDKHGDLYFKYGIISYRGHRDMGPARSGPNHKKFTEFLENIIRDKND